MASADLLEHVVRFRVRTYEVDENGHLNNAIYLQWAENLTADHAEACCFGRAWSLERGGAWLVHRHEMTFRQPVWVRGADGRPMRIPEEMVARYAPLLDGR